MCEPGRGVSTAELALDALERIEEGSLVERFERGDKQAREHLPFARDEPRNQRRFESKAEWVAVLCSWTSMLS